MGIKDLEDLRKLAMLKSQIDGISVKEISTDDFPVLGADDNVSEALALMRKTGFQEIPVVDDGAYIGMMRYGTILNKKSINPESKVSGLICNMPTIGFDTPLTKVAEIMVSENCRQVAILEGKKVKSLVSRNALTTIAASNHILKDIKVWEIMSSPVQYVKRNEPMAAAIELMRAMAIRTVPVVDNNESLCGIVGMNEVIDGALAKGEKLVGAIGKGESSQNPVDNYAVTAVKSVEWDSGLDEAVDIMVENHISTLPILDEGEMVGIVTEFDIIELMAACIEREEVFVQISGLSSEDKIYSESMYADIQAELSKISKIAKPESLNIHVSRYNEGGEKKKYSITAKMFIGGKTVNAKEFGWDLVQTNRNIL
ncbi:MAG: CBS domain-containing protein, partial [archaeon]|nr:CBS domain-containing protein [archaeon]